MTYAANDCVILLHGLARTPAAFSSLEKTLTANNFVVVNQGYPSRKKPIESLAVDAFDAALKQCSEVVLSDDASSAKNSPKIHIVTHSMGGILTRYYLKGHEIENLGRVVMLGPPNQGSELVDTLGGLAAFKWLNGPAGLQLGASDKGITASLPRADFDLGVIAGNKTFNVILSQILPKPNDGKVSVQSTKLEGMRDHIVMPVTHTFMMKNKNVITQVLHYLNNGRFDHGASDVLKEHSNVHYISSDIE